jgi:pimeloyl-ACP methyl ester carboxylesterase
LDTSRPETRRGLPCLAASLCLWLAWQSDARAGDASRRDAGGRSEPVPILSLQGPPIVYGELRRIRVPENRASGSRREIELAFVRLPSVSRRPGPPIVWLSGGPGASGIADLGTPLLDVLLDLRRLGDVVVLDQRGTGSSRPRLDCPGLLLFPYHAALARSRILDALEDQASRCARYWRGEGADLDAYNIRESAEDLESLRVAIGAEKLRLFAASFGTHLAMAAIRLHPERVDRAVLVGVVGPDHLRHLPSDFDRALSRISGLAANPGNPSSDLSGQMRDVFQRLERHPATVEVQTREAGRVPVVLGRFDLELYVRSLLSSRPAIAHLPALFAAMMSGDFTELGNAAAGWRTSFSPNASIFTMRCASGSTADREARIAKEARSAILGDVTDFAEERICRAWGVAPLPEEFRSPVRSSLPVLLVSGSLDGVAPESDAAEVLKGFPAGQHLRVAGAAHVGLGFEDSSTRAAIVRFFEGRRPGTLLVEMPRLVFESPARAPQAAISAFLQAGDSSLPSLFLAP